jgi:SAM-dependent methyltransferase
MATAGALSLRFQAASCALCGSARQDARYRFDFGGEDSAVVTCSDCGLGYTSPRPTPEALGAFYGDGYYSFKPPSKPQFSGKPPFKERLRRTILARHLGYANLTYADAPLPGFVTALLSRFLVIPSFRSDGVLLDVGCGSGERMLELESFGWKTRGLEFSEEAAAAGRSVGLHIDVGDLTTAHIADDSVATVTFYHSLEHVYSPVDTLKAAFRALKPGGDLLIAVPNYGSSERRLFGKNWDWLQMPTHLFHYDRQHLEEITRRAGFVDVGTRYSFNGYSVNTRIFGAMKPVAEILLKFYALAAALIGDGKALTVTACKPG